MQTYVIHHLGYSFWLAYEKILPARLDRTNTRVSVVEIWRGEEPLTVAEEPLFAELIQLFGEGHGERQALERLQTTMEKTTRRLQLEPLTTGAVEISNRTFGFRGRSRSQGERSQGERSRTHNESGRSRSGSNRNRSSSSSTQKSTPQPANDRSARGGRSPGGVDEKRSGETARNSGGRKPEAKTTAAPPAGEERKPSRRRGRRRGGARGKTTTGVETKP